MEDLSQVSIPPLPKIDRPKQISIEFEGDEAFPMFESLLKAVISPLGYQINRKTVVNGKTIIPFTRKKLQ